MAVLLRAVLVLCLLLAFVASATAQSGANYTVLYQSFPMCDLATDGSGAVYVLLCGEAGVVKLAPNGTQLTAFEAQYNAALASSTAFIKPLRPAVLRVSASGAVWVLDYRNAQLVGVANVASSAPTVYVISTVALNDAADFAIAPNSENLWLLTPGAGSPVQLLSPQGAVLQQWNATNVPGLADYFMYGLYATATSLYAGGCYPLSAFLYEDYQYNGYYYDESYPLYPYHVEGCDVRQFNARGALLQTFNASYPPGQYYQFVALQNMAVDGSGNVYAIDEYSEVLYQWASSGTQLQEVTSPFYDLASTPSGTVYAATIDDPFAVVTVNPATLTALTTTKISSQTFGYDRSMAVSPNGSIVYASSTYGSRILALNASTGAVLGYLGVGLLVDGEWLATDTAGNIYVSDSGSSAYVNASSVPAVYKLSSNGTLLLNITGSPSMPFADPVGVAVNPTTGELLVADAVNALIYIFSSTGTFSRSIDTTQFEAPADNPAIDTYYYNYYKSHPLSLAVSSTGTIVYNDQGLEDVIIIPASGNATSLVGSAVVNADVFGSAPTHARSAAAIVPAGRTPAPVAFLTARCSAAPLRVSSYISSVAISSDGRIFVANGNGVYLFSVLGVLLGTLIYPAQHLSITGLAYYAPTNLLYGADQGHSQIVSFSAATPATLNGSLCVLLYSLPGTVDYPWSELQDRCHSRHCARRELSREATALPRAPIAIAHRRCVCAVTG